MITENTRIDLARKLMNEIKEISNTRGITKQAPEIIPIMDMVHEDGLAVLAPDPEDPSGFSATRGFAKKGFNKPEEDMLGLYLVFPEDTKLEGVAGMYAKKTKCGAYSSATHTILINAQYPETLRYLAFVFFHEVQHAQIAQKEGRVWKQTNRPRNERYKEESKVWTLEYKIALALGGMKYERAIRKRALSINRSWQRERADTGSGEGFQLDACFGKAPSLVAKKERDMTFELFAAFMAADLFLDKMSAEERKIKTIEVLYSQNYDREDLFLENIRETNNV